MRQPAPRDGLAAALTIAVLAPLLGARPLAAHDFWIEPSRYAAAAGEPLALRLRVGEAFAGEAMPRDPAHLARFTAVGREVELAVSGVDGGEPAGFLVAPAGAYVVVYGSQPGELRLEAARFARYLVEEGLEGILLERERRGEVGEPVRERFSRCAKALVRLGGDEGDGAVFARPVGLALELVPEADPTRPAGGGELAFRLLHGGEPLAGARVAAVSGRVPARVTARTDAAGRVSLPIAEPGPWLVTAVHMVPAAADSGADWESLWASLTFELRD